ncbi:MAG: RNA 2',3'-cyclic phosphodiesterase [Candidatus Bathyarchaeia archaeon]
MSEQIRSFIAFDLEDENMLKRLSEAQTILTKTGADLKLVDPKNIHITMRFLGNISPNMIERIHEEMKKISFTPFKIEVKGVGAFPNLRRPTVVWAGIRKGTEQLRNIFQQLEPRIQALGFKPDPKGFSPHLTIARVKTGKNKAELTACINTLADYEFGVIEAKCLRLKKSVLTPKGPIYSTLEEVCP